MKNGFPYLRLAILLLVLGAAALGTQLVRAGSDELRLPRLYDIRLEGPELDLEVGGPVADCEFQFWVLDRGAWLVARPWASDPHFRFAAEEPVMRAFQVDVRRPGAAEPFLRHWIGQKVVGRVADAGPLLAAIHRTPAAVALPVGGSIQLSGAAGPAATLGQLECQLLADGRILQGWAPWPPSPLVVDHAGDIDVDLQVRRRGEDEVETHHVGRITAVASAPPRSLMRGLVAAFAGEVEAAQAVQQLAAALAVVHRLLVAEESRLEDGARNALLRQSPAAVTALEEAPGGVLQLVPGHGPPLAWSPASRLLTRADSAVALQIALDSLPDYRALLRATADLPEPARLCATIAFTVFGGYQYGTPPPGITLALYSDVGSCSTTTALLAALLQALDIPAENTYLDNHGDGHAVVSAWPLLDVPLILDTSEGLLYRWDFARGDRERPPPPLPFPGRRDLGLTLQRLFDPALTIVRSAPRLTVGSPSQLDPGCMRILHQPR